MRSCCDRRLDREYLTYQPDGWPAAARPCQILAGFLQPSRRFDTEER